MPDRLSDEMGAPGYPAGDRATEAARLEQGAPSQARGDDTDAEGAMLDPEQGGGEGDVGSENEDLIRRRAYEISQGTDAGTPEENWARAEREVRSGQASP